MTAHAHSAASLAEERAAGRISARAATVLDALRGFPHPATDRQLAEALGFADLNAVRPRITELLALGLIAEMPGVRCEVTGKTVRTTRALHPAEIEVARREREQLVRGEGVQARLPL